VLEPLVWLLGLRLALWLLAVSLSELLRNERRLLVRVGGRELLLVVRDDAAVVARLAPPEKAVTEAPSASGTPATVSRT